jgi:hypothetical protein
MVWLLAEPNQLKDVRVLRPTRARGSKVIASGFVTDEVAGDQFQFRFISMDRRREPAALESDCVFRVRNTFQLRKDETGSGGGISKLSRSVARVSAQPRAKV